MCPIYVVLTHTSELLIFPKGVVTTFLMGILFLYTDNSSTYLDLVQFSKKVVMYKLNQLASLFYFLIEERPFLLSEFLSVWFLWCMAMAGASRVKKLFLWQPIKQFRWIISVITYDLRFVCLSRFFFAFLLFPETGKDIHHTHCCLEECIHFWKFRSDVDWNW